MKHYISILTLSLAACGGGGSKPTEFTFSYGPHSMQSAIARVNDGDLIVFIHGGGWSGGSKEVANPVLDEAFNAGYSVIAVGYRLMPEFSQVHQVQDIKSVLDYIKNDRRFFGKRIMVSGGSAGGYLATQAGAEYVANNVSNITCIHNFAGPVDLLNYHKYVLAAQDLFKAYTTNPRNSPLYNVQNGYWNNISVKWYSQISAYDEVVPPDTLKEFHSYLKTFNSFELIDDKRGHAVDNTVVSNQIVKTANRCFNE